MMTAYEQGIKWGSCHDALEKRKEYVSQAEWYKACDRGDWLLWQLKRVTAPELIADKYDLITGKIVTRAINRVLSVYNAPEFKAWATRWLSGEDRSAASAAAMVTSAAASAAASAELAEWAAWAAASAAWATSATASAAELKQQAQEIHDLIPEWPG